MKNDRIIFLGTPTFAVGTLAALVNAGANIVAVVTSPDKPAGRGLKLSPSAVKTFAIENGIPVLQPLRLKDENFLEELKSLNADLQVVVAFRMLPEAVWNMPPLGTINLHASLLPQYRGAAPINRAIMNGETISGVSTFFLTHEIDTGRIAEQVQVPIANEDDAGSYHDKLMKIGADLVVQTIVKLQQGTLTLTDQQSLILPNQELKTAPKLYKEDGQINWRNDVIAIQNQIRGLSPYPCAYFEWQDANQKLYTAKVFKSTLVKKGPQSITQEAILSSDGKNFLHIITRTGVISIDELQLTGKKCMDIKSFLRGFKFDSTHTLLNTYNTLAQ